MPAARINSKEGKDMRKMWLFGLAVFLNQQILFAQPRPIEENMNHLNETTKQSLVQSACEARKKAYAPYSHYLVGAALLTSKGVTIQGCNVENASYGLTCCAERVALFKAVAEEITDFVAIAITTKDGGFPCGACRQVLNEFNPNLIVLISNENGHIVRETTLSALLPEAFGPHNLE